MTWGNSSTVVNTVTAMMTGSREACVNYMTPLGLCGIFDHTTHYGPDPSWNGDATHIDWNSYYWHKADASGLGYDRTTATGSDFTSQYFSTVRDKYNNLSTTPPEYLAAFHHVSWSYVIPSTGRTFWNELCYRFCSGCQYEANLISSWNSLNGQIDAARFNAVSVKLTAQLVNANLWRDSCTSYFHTFSKMTIPVCSQTGIVPEISTAYKKSAIGNDLPVKVFDIKGRFIGTYNGVYSAHSLQKWMTTEKNIKHGVYIIRCGTAAVSRIVTLQ